jgi:hypothetical protein
LFGRHGHTARCVENESISPHEYLVTRIEQTKVIEMLDYVNRLYAVGDRAGHAKTMRFW